ncbi:MAG: redoxin domain-containing protein [bacterium]|nr:redoxin domain-containing protein [bacterium]
MDFGQGVPVVGLGTPGRTFEDGVSFSGKERNHLFLNVGGTEFDDVGAISGLDDPADARAFALLDFDRDGWLDLAVVNANAPLLQLFRNEIPAAGVAAGAGAVIALRFVGSNTSAEPSPAASSRDGFGALVEVGLGSTTLLREHRAGEGFAAQNSATLLIGIGTREAADSVRVHWPSGAVQLIEEIPAGTLLTLYEDPAQGPDGLAVVRTAYAVAKATPWPAPRRAPRQAPQLVTSLVAESPPGALNVFTTMATWCEACRKELAQVQLLRDRFEEGELRLVGIPVDRDDSREKLLHWLRQERPAYELQLEVSSSEVAEFERWLIEALRREGLPASVVTDHQGRVLSTRFGVPTVSEILGLLPREPAPATGG